MPAKPHGGRYSLATLFWIITAIAVQSSVSWGHRWHPVLLAHDMFHASFFVAACITARRALPVLAWSLIAIGWLTTTVDVVNGITRCFQIINSSGEFPVGEGIILYGVTHAYFPVIALPACLTIPAAFLAMRATENTTSVVWKWMLAAAVVAWTDCTLAAVATVIVFEY